MSAAQPVLVAAPYSEENPAPLVVDDRSIRDFLSLPLNCNHFMLLVGPILGLAYLCLGSFLELIEFVVRNIFIIVKELPVVSTKEGFEKEGFEKEGFEKEDFEKEGVTFFTCEKTGRKHCVRDFNRSTDLNSTASVLSSAFNIGSFANYMNPDPVLRHHFNPEMFRGCIENKNTTVLINEWIDQEKIVGCGVSFEEKNENTLTVLMAITKFWSLLIKQGLFSSLTFHRKIKMKLSLYAKYYQVLEAFKLPSNKVSSLKYLAVEKGFQGQGIGSSLLKRYTEYVDKNNYHAYLQSSSLDNVRLYEKYGFRVYQQYKFNSDAPVLFLMLRLSGQK